MTSRVHLWQYILRQYPSLSTLIYWCSQPVRLSVPAVQGRLRRGGLTHACGYAHARKGRGCPGQTEAVNARLDTKYDVTRCQGVQKLIMVDWERTPNIKKIYNWCTSASTLAIVDWQYMLRQNPGLVYLCTITYWCQTSVNIPAVYTVPVPRPGVDVR